MGLCSDSYLILRMTNPFGRNVCEHSQTTALMSCMLLIPRNWVPCALCSDLLLQLLYLTDGLRIETLGPHSLFQWSNLESFVLCSGLALVLWDRNYTADPTILSFLSLWLLWWMWLEYHHMIIGY